MTRLEMRNDVKTRLALQTSTFFLDTEIEGYINQTYKKVLGMHDWASTEFGLYTTTVASQEVYDYPVLADGRTFMTDSIKMLDVNGIPYERLDFESYRKYKYENPTQTNKLYFSDYNRQIFIFPIPTASSLEILAFGKLTGLALSADGTSTIFSASETEMDEAIVQLVLSICLKKATRPSEAKTEELAAKETIETCWGRWKNRQFNAHSNKQNFIVQDYFPRNTSQNFTAGQFNQ